jgi:hypothetical protein
MLSAMAPDEPKRDRKAYLEEQIQRQQRGEPIDVEWVRAELERVNREAQQKMAASQKRLRWLVIATAALFGVFWLAHIWLEQRDDKLIIPITVVAALAAWAIYRQRRRGS